MPLTIPSKLELDAVDAVIDFKRLRVLEIGAGDGRLSHALAGPTRYWLATDTDRDELAIGAEEESKSAKRLRWAVADAGHLPVKDSSFDLVFFTWSLCCVAEAQAAAMRESWRVLRRGGVLLAIHATDARAQLEVWHAVSSTGATEVTADNLEAVNRAPLGALDHDLEARRHFTRANDALLDVLDSGGFEHAGVKAFEYQYFFDDLDELTDYLEDSHEHARPRDGQLEAAVAAMRRAPTTPKLVLIQPSMVVALRKAS